VHERIGVQALNGDGGGKGGGGRRPVYRASGSLAARKVCVFIKKLGRCECEDGAQAFAAAEYGVAHGFVEAGGARRGGGQEGVESLLDLGGVAGEWLGEAHCVCGGEGKACATWRAVRFGV